MSAAGSKYIDTEVENAINGVKQMKTLMDKTSKEHQAILQTLEETKRKKEEAVRLAREKEQELEATQEVCNETMLALWEECKPCLKHTCMRFYSRTCHSGSGLVGRQLEEFLNHSSPFSIWVNGERIDSLLERDQRQERQFEDLEERFGLLEDGVDDIFQDSTQVYGRLYPFFRPPFGGFREAFRPPVQHVRLSQRGGRVSRDLHPFFQHPYHGFHHLFQPFFEMTQRMLEEAQGGWEHPLGGFATGRVVPPPHPGGWGASQFGSVLAVVDGRALPTQQTLPFARSGVFLPPAPGQEGEEGPVKAVVKSSARQEHPKAQDLQPVEGLPAQGQADGPDDHGAEAVQDHAGGGTDLLGDADAGEVEEGDAADVPQQGQGDEGPVADLAEGVQGVFQRPPRVPAEAASRDVVHGHQQQGQDDEAKKTWVQAEGEGLDMERGEMELRCGEELVWWEGGESLAQVAPRSCGCPIPGGVEGQVGGGLEQPGVVGGVPAQGRGWHWGGFKVPSHPNHSVILLPAPCDPNPHPAPSLQPVIPPPPSTKQPPPGGVCSPLKHSATPPSRCQDRPSVPTARSGCTSCL
uniref:Clusterin N-terminal domain-containing protein n=1 Tax=Calidris pygmaea TaxID=425635 RepID=A0A8C3PL16_9CHAR